MRSRMIDLITAGELSDWNASVPVGEILSFDWDLFKNCDDTNIAMVVKCIELVDSTYNSIKNINAIEINENEEDI